MIVLSSLTALPAQFPGMEALPAETVYLMGCRTFNQFCCTFRALADPAMFCPFCTTELERRGRKPIYKWENWMLMQNEFPHKNTDRMLLVVPIRHTINLIELSRKDWGEIGGLINACRIKSGGVMFRFGDPHLNVGTIEHLHINVIEPVCGKEYRAPFAKNIAEHAEDYQRLLGFLMELNEHDEPEEWLFTPEGINKTQPPV